MNRDGICLAAPFSETAAAGGDCFAGRTSRNIVAE
jgi:hypothetical protein